MTVELAYWLQRVIQILVLCGFYMPLAVAFALVQGISNRVFLSFGDFAMFGAFAAVYAAMARYVAGDSNAAVLGISLAAAALCTAALGRMTATQVFAPLIRQPSQAFMIASVGLSIMLQEIMRLQSGARLIWLPPLYGFEGLELFPGTAPTRIGIMQAIVIATSFATVGLVCLGVSYSRFGRNWRACSQSALLASLSGVDPASVLRWSCIISAALASVSGWIIAVSYGGVSFSIGMMAGFKAMFASVIGGFGTLSGAVAGAIFLAVAETAWSMMFPMAYRDVAIFSIITLILVLKPEGLLGHAAQQENP